MSASLSLLLFFFPFSRDTPPPLFKLTTPELKLYTTQRLAPSLSVPDFSYRCNTSPVYFYPAHDNYLTLTVVAGLFACTMAARLSAKSSGDGDASLVQWIEDMGERREECVHREGYDEGYGFDGNGDSSVDEGEGEGIWFSEGTQASEIAHSIASIEPSEDFGSDASGEISNNNNNNNNNNNGNEAASDDNDEALSESSGKPFRELDIPSSPSRNDPNFTKLKLADKRIKDVNVRSFDKFIRNPHPTIQIRSLRRADVSCNYIPNTHDYFNQQWEYATHGTEVLCPICPIPHDDLEEAERCQHLHEEVDRVEAIFKVNNSTQTKAHEVSETDDEAEIEAPLT
ncbi:hypothetical protein CC80DRAFT_562205 [Byssothecium circinans]|uniref:Uncharacterized protein n=1 Tax=Byssothecium circinans TaxID=147558 RepID=A0A6A5U0U0_9PLEO|nr:hypothetical protein CC80DRAFT_562205 [Byssothecium circinans]